MVHVPDWTEKLQYLVGDQLPRSVSHDKIPSALKCEIGPIDSMAKLAKVLGLSRTTPYAAPSEPTLEKVKALYGIERGSECEGELQAGAAQDFIDEYRAFYDGFVRADSTTVSPLQQTTHVPTASAPCVLLKEDLRADTNSTQTELASLSLRTGQSEPAPGEAMLGFDLNCPDVVTDGWTTGVKRGVLTFRCADGHTTDAKDRTGYPGGVEFNGVRFTPLSVDRNEPSWLVTATGADAIGLIGDAPQDFIRILNLMPGASVSADFIACVRDIATTFVLPDGQNQSAAKQKIKKRLRELKLSGGEEGIAKLAVAEIKFAERGE